MKRLRTPRREWARLGVRVGMVAGIFAVMAVFIGIYRASGDTLAPDLKDGDLLFYLRFVPVEAGDVGIINGSAQRAETRTDMAGKVLWTMRIRNI